MAHSRSIFESGSTASDGDLSARSGHGAISCNNSPRFPAGTTHRSITMPQETTNAIELLQQDHRMVEELFDQFEQVKDADEDAAAEIIESACAALQIHDKLETE